MSACKHGKPADYACVDCAADEYSPLLRSLAAPNGSPAEEWLEYVPPSRELSITASIRWKGGQLYQWWSNGNRSYGCWVKVPTEPENAELSDSRPL